MQKVNILGVNFDPVNLDEALTRVKELLKSEKSSLVVTPNPEMLVNANNINELKDALNNADLSIADGIGVIYGAKILKKPLNNRVTGVDLMTELLEFLSKNKGSYFLFGSKPNFGEEAKNKINEKFKGIRCAGVQHGYFNYDEEKQIIKKINSSKADVVFVGLGSPKQEIWVYRNLDKLESKLCLCIGGAIDVYSGNVKRAPKWISKIGFEWLYRAFKEPKRFKRLLKIPVFIIKVLQSKRIKKA